jgi:YYY domain-containing protein
MDVLYFLGWYLAVSLAGWIAFPIAFRLFAFLPDRGFAFSKPLGLLLAGYLFWLLASLGFLRNDNSGLLLAVALLIVVQLFWLKKTGLAEVRRWLAGQKKYVLAIELIFLLAFAAWALVRAYNPAIQGTEKPMEFMLINSILRSPSLPPADAWLAGYSISYYYFGYFMVAALSRLTAVPAAVSFNLGLAVIFGMAATAATGLVANMLAMVRAARSPGRPAPESHLLKALLPGLLGCLLVLLVGNYYGALELVHDNGGLADLQVPAIYYDFGAAADLGKVQSLQQMTRQPGVRAGMVNLWNWLDLKQLGPAAPTPPAGSFQVALPNWFFSARTLHDRNLIGVETEAIDEAPAFSFLLGDLHPHVLALPFDILALALAFQWLLAGMQQGQALAAGTKSAPAWVQLGLSAVVLGGLIFLNTWDFPVYWFLTVLAWIAGHGLVLGFKRLAGLWRQVASLPIFLLFGSALLYLPFLFAFQSQAGGIAPNLVYPSRLQQELVMFGPVWIAAAVFLAALLRRAGKAVSQRLALGTAAGLLLVLTVLDLLLGAGSLLGAGNSASPNFYPLLLSQATGLLLQRRLVDSPTAILAALMVGYTLSLVYGLACPKAIMPTDNGNESHVEQDRFPGLPAVLLALGMLLTGALLLIGPEYVFLRDDFNSRMNTMFKLYFQTWILWGLAAAFGIGYLLSLLRGGRRLVFSLGMAVVLLPGLVYLYGGLLSKTNNFSGSPTLDGTAYFTQAYPNDWAAIQWLEQNVAGSPVILEGSQGAYWSDGPSSRFAMATGLPTLMGWANHEAQWRGPGFNQVNGRQDEIRAIYQTGDWKTAAALLDKYKVSYVIVSSWEKGWYRPVNTAKFDRNMKPVFSSGDVTIYQR